MTEPTDNKRSRRSTYSRFRSFILTHKALAAAVALLCMGASGALYASRYATMDQVERKIDQKHRSDDWIKDQIQRLKESDAEFRSTLKAIHQSAEATRDDMKVILQHVLANPDTRSK